MHTCEINLKPFCFCYKITLIDKRLLHIILNVNEGTGKQKQASKEYLKKDLNQSEEVHRNLETD